jgi:spectrin beta
VLKLYKLNFEIEDLEQWIAEREVVAGSHELGQDFEHVTMLRDRFREFAQETESIGQERVAAVNEICDQLIQAGHSDAATIAEWKDGINEAWTDLLELIDTRTQALAASWELYKFFNDCLETLARIREKQMLIPEDIGKDARSVSALQRRLASFEHDLINLGAQVQAIQEEAAKLIVAYSGEKARDIQRNEMDVVNAWRNLQFNLDSRKRTLDDSNDLYRFFGMVRDLLNWMSDISRQMSSSEKPRDVSGVELLMNNHRGLKAEIDARAENFTICVNLGKELIARRHERSQEVRDKLVQLGNQRGNMMEQWEERWEYLHLILEVYQFARDASVAEAWLIAHEPYVNSQDFGATLDAVETLMKKHEAFEKSAATQEERFAALERLTTLEMKDRQRRQQEEYKRQHPGEIIPAKKSYAEQYIEEFVPPIPEPEPPKPQPQQVKQQEQQLAEMQQQQQQLESRPSPQQLEQSAPKSAGSPTGAAAAGSDSIIEGMLNRKHEWESRVKKSSNRSWDKVYVVLNNRSLLFYKDQKHAKAEPTAYFRHEQPVDLDGATTTAATDYTKRPHVFRVKLLTGSEYLFQCRNDDEMVGWVNQVKAACGAEDASAAASKAMTMPPSLEGKRDEPKRRSFLTLGRKSKERE